MGRLAIIPARALFDARLHPRHIRLLLALGVFTDTNGWCWPSLKTLSEIVGDPQPDGTVKPLSPGRISQLLKDLKTWGYVEIFPRYGENGRQLSNAYRVVLSTSDKPQDAEDAHADFGRFLPLGKGEEKEQEQRSAPPFSPIRLKGGVSPIGLKQTTHINDPKGTTQINARLQQQASTTHNRRGGTATQAEVAAAAASTELNLPAEVVDDLKALGWRGPVDEVVRYWQEDPGRVENLLWYAKKAGWGGGLLRTALRSGEWPPELKPDSEAYRRRYREGPFAEFFE
ncbi:MAG TPA: helix-turn-helix domain-containing protein [Anaerolineaceae bacterium]|nr:helix-turn-helix domain-containing protein [Anaerolineaceae bacterium]